ncbi:MAG: nucleotidyltransferase domain-containing protein [Bacteroidales bacterium]|nr:MAG: nucleotidyltransferase domain-containing protein [Bacteroidales bacterium]
MDEKLRHISKLIKRNIAEIEPNAQVILYGSRARGDARNDSDWDILVLTDYLVDINREKIFRDHLYELELQTGEPLSIFVYSKQDWNTKQRITPYYVNVTRQGIQL